MIHIDPIPSHITHEEIDVAIHDQTQVAYGANQYWYPKKANQMSGCGPVAAAMITAYLAKYFPDKYERLYAYPTKHLTKSDMIAHMVEIRKYVRPGMMGLISVATLEDHINQFTRSRGVHLNSRIQKAPVSETEAIAFIQAGLTLNVPVSLLVLTHPARSINEYTWHWMVITGLYAEATSKKWKLVVSSWGNRHVLDFSTLWNERNPSRNIIHLGYFY